MGSSSGFLELPRPPPYPTLRRKETPSLDPSDPAPASPLQARSTPPPPEWPSSAGWPWCGSGLDQPTIPKYPPAHGHPRASIHLGPPTVLGSSLVPRQPLHCDLPFPASAVSPPPRKPSRQRRRMQPGKRPGPRLCFAPGLVAAESVLGPPLRREKKPNGDTRLHVTVVR